MCVIGLCGGSGSGKGEVSSIFTHCGFHVFDSDREYHDMTSQDTACTRALAEAFGTSVLTSDGALNRSVLAEIVFADDATADDRRMQLNQIAHHHVKLAFQKFLAEHSDVPVVLDAPLLFEAGMEKLCDKVVVVTAPRDMRIERICARDNITEKDAWRRIRSQLDDAYLIAHSDYHIDNRGTLSELDIKTRKIIKNIKEEFGL